MSINPAGKFDFQTIPLIIKHLKLITPDNLLEAPDPSLEDPQSGSTPQNGNQTMDHKYGLINFEDDPRRNMSDPKLYLVDPHLGAPLTSLWIPRGSFWHWALAMGSNEGPRRGPRCKAPVQATPRPEPARKLRNKGIQGTRKRAADQIPETDKIGVPVLADFGRKAHVEDSSCLPCNSRQPLDNMCQTSRVVSIKRVPVLADFGPTPL